MHNIISMHTQFIYFFIPSYSRDDLMIKNMILIQAGSRYMKSNGVYIPEELIAKIDSFVKYGAIPF